jgi:hypothetical protein
MGLAAWKWLFIIQGCAGILVGICSWILLPLPPDQIKDKKHWLLTIEEIELAVARFKSNSPLLEMGYLSNILQATTLRVLGSIGSSFSLLLRIRRPTSTQP